MKKNLKDLSSVELGKLFPIKIVKYDNSWINYFNNEKQTILNILGEKNIIRIVHFGSTAIPNMSSKPIIDILIEIPSKKNLRKEITKLLISNGYNHMKNHSTHLMFVKGYNKTGYDDIRYHLHIGTIKEEQLWDRINFKDFLIDNPLVAKEYEKLKLKLSKKYKFDREAYTDGKSDFINNITIIEKKKNNRHTT